MNRQRVNRIPCLLEINECRIGDPSNHSIFNVCEFPSLDLDGLCPFAAQKGFDEGKDQIGLENQERMASNWIHPKNVKAGWDVHGFQELAKFSDGDRG